jgi:hypothetical protein
MHPITLYLVAVDYNHRQRDAVPAYRLTRQAPDAHSMGHDDVRALAPARPRSRVGRFLTRLAGA